MTNIGASDTIRFIQQFHLGYGDYTKERNTQFKDLTIEEILKEINTTQNK